MTIDARGGTGSEHLGKRSDEDRAKDLEDMLTLIAAIREDQEEVIKRHERVLFLGDNHDRALTKQVPMNTEVVGRLSKKVEHMESKGGKHGLGNRISDIMTSIVSALVSLDRVKQLARNAVVLVLVLTVLAMMYFVFNPWNGLAKQYMDRLPIQQEQSDSAPLPKDAELLEVIAEPDTIR